MLKWPKPQYHSKERCVTYMPRARHEFIGNGIWHGGHRIHCACATHIYGETFNLAFSLYLQHCQEARARGDWLANEDGSRPIRLYEKPAIRPKKGQQYILGKDEQTMDIAIGTEIAMDKDSYEMVEGGWYRKHKTIDPYSGEGELRWPCNFEDTE